ncbi:endoribonuclease Dicer-like [Leptopilina boulardi]|uniref:endoribonuclease Dicer-like n=1 Tax=Leptopilina boulardi TaxID=63433 RepID=UPI0021F59FD0|nr:endoribonuclease Dicer-like [Leptopilina boulardi]
MEVVTKAEEQDLAPRAYQIDLFEKAVSNNTIIFLPTGSGKTYIAVQVVKKMSAAIQGKYSSGTKRTVFIVNTVPLVSQQTDYLTRHTGLKAKGFSGDMQVDFWDNKKWWSEIEDTPILVMIAQIFVDIVNHGIMSLDRVNLIVFDECHRAVSDHPMRQIMQRFEECSSDNRPRVLGLSATLLNSNVKLEKVQETIESLEITFHAKIASIESLAIVAGFSTNPKENCIKYNDEKACCKTVDDIIDEVTKILKIVKIPQPSDNNHSSFEFKSKSRSEKLKNILSDIKENLLDTGTFGGSKAVLLHMIQLESIKRVVAEPQAIFVLEYILSKLMILRKIFDVQMQGLSLRDQIYQFSSDRVLKLIAILKQFNDQKNADQKFCCIIFVQRRFTAQVLYHILKSLNQSVEEFKFLIPEYMVGFNNDPFKNAKETMCIAKWNQDVLRRFRSEKSNCIVATDVVDEGVDIPHCTLIVRFDLPMDFRSYIQSKGRARHSSSQYTMLVANDNTKFESKYIQFHQTEQFLQQILVGQTDFRTLPNDEDIENELYSYKIDPYLHINAEGKPCVITEQSAIALLNRYCANLYKSKFISLSPTWSLHKKRDLQSTTELFYKVSLTLPIVSPLKEVIMGDWMKAIDDAKRSVAMKTCIRLKEIGELNDNLNPIDPDDIQENVNHLFPNWEEENTNDHCAPGTYSKKRKHNLIHPKPLYGAFPQVNKTLFLHLLKMTPKYTEPLDNRHLVFYNLLKDNAGYGILTTTEFPEIPNFPIFMNVGPLEIHVEVNFKRITLDEEKINAMRGFHTMVFFKLLNLVKEFMVFDVYNLENNFAVVPVDKNCEIDWKLIYSYQTIENKEPPSPFEINENDYELALVKPNYRAAPNIYIVTMICDDITADSSFPDYKFHSYVEYYRDHYKLTITNVKQHLLEVKTISTKINCIVPRSTSKKTKENIDLTEHLVPELCDIINFPALYWLKATALPSIIHRITQLLIADDLRQEIEKNANITVPIVKKPVSLTISTIPMAKQKEILETTLDESSEMDVSDLQPEIRGPEIDVLNMEAEYPWSKRDEPPDLIRNADIIQLIHIETYHKFMGKQDRKNMPDILMKSKQNVSYFNRPNMTAPVIKMLSNTNFEGLNNVILMKALTSKISNDAFDLERMETLGDSFLKFAVSLFLYETYKSFNEGQLTYLKGKLIGNRNLYYCGKNKNIPGRIKVEEYIPNSNFIVPAFTAERSIQGVLIDNEISSNVLYELHIPDEEKIKGYISEFTLDQIQDKVLTWNDTPSNCVMEQFLGRQNVADKVVADSVESIIGASLCTLGTEGALNILKWFQIIPFNSQIEMKFISVSSKSFNEIVSKQINDHMPWANMLEKRLNYTFNDRTLLLQAFSHPSYSINGLTPCYQRLEFLGDAVLDFLITVYIYEYCGELSPGDLTDLRSALVNNITFACLSVRYGLHTALLAYVPLLHDTINRFVKFQEEKNHAVDVELLWILLEESECNLAEHVDVPKALGDIFESLIGAIYLDSGKDIKKVWEIVFTMMHEEFELFCADVPKQPIRVIYETGVRPRFLKATIVESTGQVMVGLEITVEGKAKLFHGFGANKKQAKSAASKQALKYYRSKKKSKECDATCSIPINV